MKIGTRLAILAASFCIIIAGVGAFGLYGMDRAKERTRSMYEDRTLAVAELGNVLYDTLLIRRRVDEAGDATLSANVWTTFQDVARIDGERDRDWHRYLNTYQTKEEQTLADQAQLDMDRLRVARDQVISTYRQLGGAAGAAAKQATRLDALFDAFHSDMVRLIDLQARVAAADYDIARRNYTWFLAAAITSILAGMLIGGLASFLLIRSIIVPLREAIRVAGRIADGDLATEVRGGGVGEIAELMYSLARMLEGLREMSAQNRAQVTHLEEMSNGLPVAVYQMRFDPDGKGIFTFVSQRVKDILGVPADELLTDPDARWRYGYPQDQALVRDATLDLIRRVHRGDSDLRGEATVRMLFGNETRIVRAASYARRSCPDGTVTFNGYYQDITEQRRSQRLLKDILDETPSVVFVKDPLGRHLLTNRAFDQLFRLPPGGALGKTDFDIFPQEVAERVRAIDRQVMDTSRVQQFEEEIPVPGGTHASLTIKFPLLDELGHPYALCGVGTDISERRLAETRLRDSEAYNKILFDESHTPIVVIDPESGQYVDCNRAAVKIHGLTSKDDILGKRTLDVSAPVQSDGTEMPAARSQILANRPQICEWRYRRPDGEIWDAQVHMTTFRHGGKELLQATFEDITVRKRAEQAIQAAKQAAEDIARVKSDFLATMSHEIRTPLTAILGNLELLERSSLTELQHDRLHTITDSSRTLLHIIDDILDFSKIESGQLRLEDIPFDVVETVEQAVGIFAPGAQVKGLTLCLAFAPEMTRGYYGDPARIRQIVVNLVSNAVKFTGSGSVTVDVRAVHGRLSPPTLTISVRDTGIGIPAAIQSELFEPFRQADSSVTRRFGGTGLGLALCKKLAELMGGTISVTSEVGVGSTFAIQIPVRLDPDGMIGGWRCPDGSCIALTSGSPEWQSSIAPHFFEWGLNVISVSRREELPPVPVPLLVVGAAPSWMSVEDIAARAPSRWIITAVEDGPRHPIATGNRVSVSCFSLDGLRHAIASALQGRRSAPLPASVSKRSIGLPGAGQPVHVLVAEDHAANRMLFADQLKMLGYDADLAENGEVALEKFSAREYDVVLTDLSMPVLDGFALAARLRAQGEGVPIIAITAHTTASELEHCTEVGISDVLLKPFSLEDLGSMLQKHTRELVSGHVTTTPDKSSKPAKRRLPPAFFEALATATLQSLAAIQDALGRNDTPVVLQELHSIKGAFLMAQRPDVAAECRRLEGLARNDDLIGVANSWPSFERLIRDSL